VPPERRGSRRRLDVTDDVYAFGAVFYQALSGRPPAPDFASGSLETAKPLARSRPDLSARLVYVVGRALASDPGERYASAAELLADLESGKVLRKKTPRKA
jgi:serine/threonine protein kinase